MGGKKAIRALIYKLFPKSYGRYIEVFGGGGWVLFGKPPECKGGMEVYNDCEFIRELYEGYYITAVTRTNNLAQRYDGGSKFPEVIITNYDPKEREKASFQLNLFDCGFGMEDDNEPC